MPKDAKGKALADAKRAQLEYERDVKAAREARRKSFARAQKAGSSLVSQAGFDGDLDLPPI